MPRSKRQEKQAWPTQAREEMEAFIPQAIPDYDAFLLKAGLRIRKAFVETLTK